MSDERPEDVAGDAPDDDTVSLPAIEPAPERARTSRSAASLLPAIALGAALLAMAGSGFAVWLSRQSHGALNAADAQTRTQLQLARAAADDAAAELDRVDAAVDDNLRQLRSLDDRLEAVPGRFADVERRIEALQGGSFDARIQWLEAEAAYYLGVANAELQLGSRWSNALTALRLADARLREIGDPGLARVRERLAAEILALESVRLVDTEGLAHSLSRLNARIADLPLRSGVSGHDPAAPAAEVQPGFERLWSSVRDAVAGIITVERRDEAVRSELTAAEVRLIRRQLGIELQAARLALIGGEAQVFRASLEQASVLLREEFAQNSADVEGGLRLLESMLALDIAPSPPDISGSLNALRARGQP